MLGELDGDGVPVPLGDCDTVPVCDCEEEADMLGDWL